MKLTIAMVMSILSLYSCTGIKVNGRSLTEHIVGKKKVAASSNRITKKVDAGTFYGISTAGAFEIEYSPGNPSLEIVAPDNIQEHIITTIEDGILNVRTDGVRISGMRKGIILRISTPSLEKIELSGACEFRSPRIQAENLKILLSGAGEINIDSLKADDVNIKGSGAAEISIDQLECSTLELKISGAGDVDLGGVVSKGAEVSISGAADVDIEDLLCENINTRISGAGCIRRR